MYGKKEEIANWMTHGLGIFFSVVGVVVLIILAALKCDAIAVVSCSIYGAALILMYSSSTIYHLVKTPKAKRIWRLMDHLAIYLLIAGTYTPFCLIMLKGKWGWPLFFIVWALAIIGITLKSIFMGRYGFLSTTIYVAMGWVAVIAAKPFYLSLRGGAFNLLILGGVFFNLGVIFYANKKIPYNHAIWHLFVLGGSISHYCSILFYVVLRSC